ncbi:MAG: VWA domain-containing protein [Gaiellaceae bacterium]
MTFATPIALTLLILVPALLLAYVVVQRRRVKYALRFTNLPLLAGVVDRAPRWRRHVPPLLVLTALAALVVGIARPQRAVAVPRKAGTVILTIDRSGSMLATDVSPTRMAAARAAAATFIKGLPSGFKVGLVSFSDKADVVLPPTSDHDEALKALATLQAENGTALGDAIGRSVNLGLADIGAKVAPSGSPLVVLVLSDGASTTGDLQPLEAAAQAKTANVPVYTVALGTDQGTITATGPNGETNVYRVPPDPTTLRAVAQETNGKFFEAADADSLKSIYKRIGKTVGTKVEKRELSAAFTGAGAVVLLLGSALSLAWFNRLP